MINTQKSCCNSPVPGSTNDKNNDKCMTCQEPCIRGRNQMYINQMYRSRELFKIMFGYTYENLHKHVTRYKLRTGICSKCGNRGHTDFSNISGEYKWDIYDYEELCRKCHKEKDRHSITIWEKLTGIPRKHVTRYCHHRSQSSYR